MTTFATPYLYAPTPIYYSAIEELAAPDFKLNPNAEKLRQRAEEKARSRDASALHAPAGTLNRMQFTFAVDAPAAALGSALAPDANGADVVVVGKPDLRPSA